MFSLRVLSLDAPLVDLVDASGNERGPIRVPQKHPLGSATWRVICRAISFFMVLFRACNGEYLPGFCPRCIWFRLPLFQESEQVLGQQPENKVPTSHPISWVDNLHTSYVRKRLKYVTLNHKP